jgi:hypothetical protein
MRARLRARWWRLAFAALWRAGSWLTGLRVACSARYRAAGDAARWGVMMPDQPDLTTIEDLLDWVGRAAPVYRGRADRWRRELADLRGVAGARDETATKARAWDDLVAIAGGRHPRELCPPRLRPLLAALVAECEARADGAGETDEGG